MSAFQSHLISDTKISPEENTVFDTFLETKNLFISEGEGNTLFKTLKNKEWPHPAGFVPNFPGLYHPEGIYPLPKPLKFRKYGLSEKVSQAQSDISIRDRIKERISQGFETWAPKKISNLPGHSPSLAADDTGDIYLVWEHGNALWLAVNTLSGWCNYGKIPGGE